MRIALRTSGGRGEYELAGHQADVRGSDLLDRQIAFQLTPEITIPGAQAARHVQGKPRIRLHDQATGRHAYLLLAAALLLPAPKRELRATGTGSDFVRLNGYAVGGIDVDVVRVAAANVVLRPTVLWLENSVGLVRSVAVPARMAAVQGVWNAARGETSDVADLARRHEIALAGGEHREMEKAASGLQVMLATTGDMIDDLAIAVGAEVDDTAIGLTTEAIPAAGEEDETDPDEAARRVVAQWRRSVARGAAGRTFSQLVRGAYGDRCLLSGERLPKLPSTLSAGVDGRTFSPGRGMT